MHREDVIGIFLHTIVSCPIDFYSSGIPEIETFHTVFIGVFRGHFVLMLTCFQRIYCDKKIPLTRFMNTVTCEYGPTLRS